MKPRHGAALALVVFFGACTITKSDMNNWGGVPESRLLASWRAQFLTKSQGIASEHHVVSVLGPPTLIQKRETGDLVLYKYSGAGAGGSFCTSYTLTFDSGRVLRSWARNRSCTP